MPRTGLDRRRYRGGRWLLTCALVVAGLLPGAAAVRADEWTVRTGVHVDAWSGAGQDGRQILVPLSVFFDTPAWGVSLRGAAGDSERDPGGGRPSGEIAGLTDTTLSGYYRLVVADVEIRAGLNLDLPTGVSRLKTRDLAAIQDEDLALLERFGEGFDVNPTVSAYRNFGRFGIGGGIGYLWTGEYDPTSQVPSDDLDPGDELTVAVLGDAYLAESLRLVASLAYTYFTADQVQGRDAFREGDEFDARLALEWRPEPWWVVAGVRAIIRSKAERLDVAGRLGTEPSDSRGDDLRGSVTVGYILDDVWALEGTVEVKHVFENGYPESDPFFDGGRTKVSIGPTVTWTPHRRFGVETGLRYFIMDVERSPFFPRTGTIHGVHADVRVTYRF